MLLSLLICTSIEGNTEKKLIKTEYGAWMSTWIVVVAHVDHGKAVGMEKGGRILFKPSVMERDVNPPTS